MKMETYSVLKLLSLTGIGVAILNVIPGINTITTPFAAMYLPIAGVAAGLWLIKNTDKMTKLVLLAITAVLSIVSVGFGNVAGIGMWLTAAMNSLSAMILPLAGMLAISELLMAFKVDVPVLTK